MIPIQVCIDSTPQQHSQTVTQTSQYLLSEDLCNTFPPYNTRHWLLLRFKVGFITRNPPFSTRFRISRQNILNQSSKNLAIYQKRESSKFLCYKNHINCSFVPIPRRVSKINSRPNISKIISFLSLCSLIHSTSLTTILSWLPFLIYLHYSGQARLVNY